VLENFFDGKNFSYDRTLNSDNLYTRSEQKANHSKITALNTEIQKSEQTENNVITRSVRFGNLILISKIMLIWAYCQC